MSLSTTNVVSKMNHLKTLTALILSVVLATSVYGQNVQVTSANDTARFLAGMPLSPDSPLTEITQDPQIKPHAAYFDAAFGTVEKNQLAKIRVWSAANLSQP